MDTFFHSSVFKCNVNYTIAYFYLLISNVFLYFVLFYNIFNIDFQENKAVMQFILFIFAEFIILLITRCICIPKKNEKEKENLLLYEVKV